MGQKIVQSTACIILNQSDAEQLAKTTTAPIVALAKDLGVPYVTVEEGEKLPGGIFVSEKIGEPVYSLGDIFSALHGNIKFFNDRLEVVEKYAHFHENEGIDKPENAEDVKPEETEEKEAETE